MEMANDSEAGKHVKECHDCIHRREIPGDAHYRCAKPDPEMTGHSHGIRSGWFAYPINFDPTWKTKACANHEPRQPK
jgi:hypothetical protein